MNRYLKLVASTWTLALAAVLPAADVKPVLPALSIQQVCAQDATDYAMWIAHNNGLIKAKLGIERYFRVYIGEAAGEDSGAVFSVSGADSFTTLVKNWEAITSDAALIESRAHLNAIRELGPQVNLKAVRYDGTNPTGFLYNTWAAVSDEAAYLKGLDGLRALFDGHDFKDVKINAYRVIAGRSTSTHLVSLNAPTAARRAALLDAMATETWVSDWLASVAKTRTVVRNGTYREITR